MNRDRINELYFTWLYDMMCNKRYARGISYFKLFEYLYDREFVWSIPRDENRAVDGIDLRYRFAYGNKDIEDVDLYLTGPCSVLEMIVALAIRCEETIMTDPSMGDRTAQWFWGMVTNLGLGSMSDDDFDEQYVDYVITTFLNRDYQPNGKGGLFTVRNSEEDLRDVEIFYQLCWYLNNII